MKARKPILFPLKKRHGEFEFESSMRGSAHKIQKTRNLHNVLLNENSTQYSIRQNYEWIEISIHS